MQNIDAEILRASVREQLKNQQRQFWKLAHAS